MEYACIHGKTSAELTQKVNAKIQEGFEPIGGASCSIAYVDEYNTNENHMGRDISIVQAMLKP